MSVNPLQPGLAGHGPELPLALFEAVQQAILRAMPRRGRGVPLAGVLRAVAADVPAGLAGGRAPLARASTSVLLDLEARGILQRLPGPRFRLDLHHIL